MAQRVRKSFFGGRGIAAADSRPWIGRGLSNLVSRTLPIRGRYTEAEVLQAIVNAPTTWAAMPTASSPPSFSYGAAGNDTPDTTKLGGVAWKRFWFRGDNGQIEGAGGGRTLLQRADFANVLTQGPALGGGVNYNNNSGNSTEWWQNFQSTLRAGQDPADVGDFSNWGWGFTLTGRGFAFTGQSYTDFVVYVEEGGVLKRCPYQAFPRSDIYAYVDFGTSATRNILLVIEPDSWSSEMLVPTTATMVPWSGWRAGRLNASLIGDSYFQRINVTAGAAFAEQLVTLCGGHPAVVVSAQGGSGYASDNNDPTNVRAFNFPHRLNRISAGQPDIKYIYGGINDGWPTTSTSAGTVSTAAAIDKVIRDARMRDPSALHVYGSPWAPNEVNGQNPAGKWQLLNNYLRDVAIPKDPGPWIFIDSLNGTWKTYKGTQRATAEGPWITGTGRTGAPNGTGNADIYIGPDPIDDTHPNDAGQTFISEKNSQYMHEAAASMLAGNTYNLSASDAVAAGDGSSTAVVAAASAFDAAAPADAAASAGATAAVATDSAAAGDAATVLTAAGVAAADAVAPVDSASGAGVVAAAAADAVSAADASTAASVSAAAATDAVAAGDAGSAQMTRPAAAIDAASASDVAATQTVQASAAADSVAAIDVAQALAGGTLLAVDAVSSGDAAGAQAVRPMPVADAISATDGASAVAVLQLAAADSVAATDAAVTQAVQAVLAAEALTAVDSALAIGSFGLAVAEVFVLTDVALAVAQTTYVFVRDERTYRVPPEHRVLRVPPENRTFKASK